MIDWQKLNLTSLFRRTAHLKFAYEIVFNNPDCSPEVRQRAQDIVMRDFARYCHAMSVAEDARAIGRRDVWLYLSKYLRLSEDELTILYSGANPEDRYQLHTPGATYITDGDV